MDSPLINAPFKQSGSEVEYASPGIARRALLDQQALLDAHLCDVPPGVDMGDRFKPVM